MNLNGGVEKGTLEIAEVLQKEGITNYVVSNTGAGVALLQRKKIPHIALPVDTKNPIKMFFNAKKTLTAAINTINKLVDKLLTSEDK